MEGTCFFCGRNTDVELITKHYHKIENLLVGAQTQHDLTNYTVNIPRCKSCKNKHDRINYNPPKRLKSPFDAERLMFNFIYYIIPMLGSAGLSYFFYLNWEQTIIKTVIQFIIISVVVILLVGWLFSVDGTLPRFDKFQKKYFKNNYHKIKTFEIEREKRNDEIERYLNQYLDGSKDKDQYKEFHEIQEIYSSRVEGTGGIYEGKYKG